MIQTVYILIYHFKDYPCNKLDKITTIKTFIYSEENGQLWFYKETLNLIQRLYGFKFGWFLVEKIFEGRYNKWLRLLKYITELAAQKCVSKACVPKS